MELNNLAGMGITQARQDTPAPPKFDSGNVNDQLASTLNQGGLLMRIAQSKGQSAASARGLGNSTIGIDAAQRAMVDAALPIAQQNAQQSHQRTMQNDSKSFTAGQADLDRQQQLATLEKQQSWQGGQSALDRQQQLTVLDKQFGQESAQLAKQVVANTHGMYMGAIDSAMGSYNERYAAIMADSSMKATDKQTLLNNMKKELNSTLGMYQQLYSNISTIRPDWSQFPTTQLPGVKIT